MSKHYVCNKALCPFYKHEDTQVVYCESFLQDSVLHIAFASKTNALEFKKKYCRKNYLNCHIYKLLEDNLIEVSEQKDNL